MAERYGLGAEVDPDDERDYLAETHPESPIRGVAEVARGQAVSMAPLLPKFHYQGVQPACVGFTTACGIWLDQLATGRRNVERPASMFCWSMARHQHNDPQAPLPVAGTMLRAGARGAQKHGWATETEWPYEPSASEYHDGKRIDRAQARPPKSVRDAAFDRRGLRNYFRAAGVSSWLRALTRRHPIGYAIPVGDEFLDPKGPAVIDRLDGGQRAGNHAMLLTGFREIGGRLYFENLNWWHGWRLPMNGDFQGKPVTFVLADALEDAFSSFVYDTRRK